MARIGRPPKPEGRYVQMNIRVHPKAYKIIADQAAAANVPPTAIARDMIMKALAKTLLGE